MRNDDELHFEPYIHLAGLTHEAVLLSWGGFYFRQGGLGGTAASRQRGHDRWMVIDDAYFDEMQPTRKDSIGERSASYGAAVVEVLDDAGQTVASKRVVDRNHVWIEGLEPNTRYRYRLRVDGESWTDHEHVNWTETPDGTRGLYRDGRSYECRFRTHPAPEAQVPLTFAVLGDFGIGIRTDRDDALRQRDLARALERAVDEYDVRLVLTLGDNIYLGKEGTGATGDEDDDWFFTFYQPYRYLLNRIPFYPTVGNHDAGETEKSDDREQLNDNYFLDQRFAAAREANRSSVDPGLFYVFGYGADIEFVCIDTTRFSPEEERYFAHPKQRAFLEEAFPPAEGRPKWRFPFSHHPTYTAGPNHSNTEGMEEVLVPFFRRSGVRLVLAGHEHNLQVSRADGIVYLVSGAGGKLDRNPPTAFERAHTQAWAGEGHFLIVEVTSERTVVRPFTIGPDAEAAPLVGQTPAGDRWEGPIVVER